MKPDYSIIPHLNCAIAYLRDCGWMSQKCPLGLLVRARDEIVRLREELEHAFSDRDSCLRQLEAIEKRFRKFEPDDSMEALHRAAEKLG